MNTQEEREDEWKKVVAKREEQAPGYCKHVWVDSYIGGGYSRKTPDISILLFFCKKCLEIRKKRVDTSDLLVHPDTLELYEEYERDE